MGACKRWARCWLPAFFVVWLALAFRLADLEHTRQNYDRAAPHGLGIAIREAINEGRWHDLPRVSLTASINLPNPAGTSYFYALLAAIDPHPYLPTALNAMSGVVVASVALAVTRTLWGNTAGVLAGILAASSLWSRWIARGAWLQGPLEAMSAFGFWLLSVGLTHFRARYIAASCLWAATCLHTYLVALGLAAQTMAGALLSIASRSRALLRASLFGIMAILFSAYLFTAAARASGVTLSRALDNPNAYNEITRAGELNLDALRHFLRLASGRDFENTFVETDTPHFATRDQLSDQRANFIELLMLLGLGALILRLRRKSRRTRLLLLWSGLPLLGALVISNALMRDWKVHVFYLTLSAPVPYVLAGAPFGVFERARQRTNAALLAGVLGAGSIALSVWNAHGEVEAILRFPFHHDGLYSLSLHHQQQLAALARAQGCRVLVGEEDGLWLASLWGSARLARSELRARDAGVIWQVTPHGDTCALRMDDWLPPPSALAFVLDLGGQKRTDRTPARAAVYRSLPHPEALSPPPHALTVNLGEGWRLLRLETPTRAAPGETLEVIHTWLVGAMPNEPFGLWYFAPFVKLLDAQGRELLQVDRSPALLGYQWRSGHVLVSSTRLTLPSDLPAGEYTLAMSLFDPNLKKNAVYFDPLAPSVPIVTIPKRVLIEEATGRT